MDIYTLPEYKASLEEFLRFYDLNKIVCCPDSKPRLKSKTKRKCRFCGKRYKTGETTFKSDAHIIPEFLGNKHLVSDFECDKCNRKFASYEDDLANFIGPIRSILATKGKGGTATFKSADISIREIEMLGQGGLIEIKKDNVDNDSIVVDDNSGKLTFRKKAYRPLKVYKAFLKIALGCLDSRDLPLFREAFQFLNRDITFENNQQPICIHRLTLPLSYNNEKPFMLVHKKKHNWLKMPTFSFAFHTMNYIFQIQPPFHTDDIFIYNKPQMITSYFLPPLSNNKWSEVPKIHGESLAMSSNEKIDNDREVLVLGGFEKPHSVSKLDFSNKTVQHNSDHSDRSKIQAVILIPKDVILKTPPDFTEIK